MIKKEIEKFAILYEKMEDIANSLETRFKKDYPDINPFPNNKDYQLQSIDNYSVTYEDYYWDETQIIELPIAVLYEEGLLEYVAAKREENIQRELKIKEMQETAINQKAEAEYQIYLRLKEKFEGELK